MRRVNRMTNETGSGVMSVSASHAEPFYLKEVRVTLAGTVTDLADLSISVDSGLGTEYDHELGAPDPDADLTTVLSFRYADPVPPLICVGDVVDVSWANTGSETWAIEILGYPEG